MSGPRRVPTVVDVALDQRESSLRPALGGRICFWGGIVGALQAVVVLAALLLADPAGATRYSHPFSPGVWSIAQITFAIQHVALLLGVIALAGVTGIPRVARYGLLGAGGGLFLLADMELFALTAADATVGDPRAELVDSLYGIPTVITGVTLVVAGVSLARSRALPGGRRWIVLVTGLYVFVALLPAVFGPDAAGRVAIGVWMLLFAALGLAARPSREEART